MKTFHVIFDGKEYTVQAHHIHHYDDYIVFYDDNNGVVASVPTYAFVF